MFDILHSITCVMLRNTSVKSYMEVIHQSMLKSQFLSGRLSWKSWAIHELSSLNPFLLTIRSNDAHEKRQLRSSQSKSTFLREKIFWIFFLDLQIDFFTNANGYVSSNFWARKTAVLKGVHFLQIWKNMDFHFLTLRTPQSSTFFSAITEKRWKAKISCRSTSITI